MKKQLIVVLVFLAGISAVSAQQAGQFSAGARLGGVFGFHSMDVDFDDIESKMNFNFGVYGAYAVMDGLSIQAELNFMITQGVKESFSYYWEDDYYGDYYSEKGTSTITYSSLDIPILVKYTLMYEPMLIGILAGPYLSIPISDMEASFDVSVEEYDSYYGYDYYTGSGTNKTPTDGITFGLTAGLFLGYPIGPGLFVGDIRFSFDLSSQKAKERGESFDVISRRGLAVSVGYEISF